MNNKLLNSVDQWSVPSPSSQAEIIDYRANLKYAVLSHFHRGLFWGIISAWTALISGAFGAVIAKVVYLDNQERVIARNVVRPKAIEVFNDSLPEVTDSVVIPISSNDLESRSAEFTFPSSNNFLFSTLCRSIVLL